MSEVTVADRLAEVTQRIVLRELRPLRATKPLVLLSGGVDSQLLLRGLLEWGIEPTALSFALEGQPSMDLRLARKTCERWGVDHRTLWLPRDVPLLAGYVRVAVGHFGLKKKVDIECFWPRWHALGWAEARGFRVVVTGDGGDGHFGVSRKAMIECRDDVAKLDAYRRWYFERPNPAQVETIAAHASELGLATIWPLRHPELIEAFMGTSWYDVNQPRQKEPFRRAFPDIPDLPKHTNLQLGGSGIAEAFRALLPLVPGTRDMARVYDRVARGAVQDQLY